MSNYSTLKASIDANIRKNGRQLITGPVLNAILNAVVNSLGDGYLFRGVAIPSTNPGTPDQNVAYLAITEGTYTHMGGLSVTDGELSVFSYNGAWSKIPLALVPTKTSQLDNDLRFVTSEEMGESLSSKQDTIKDLSEIRSGAALANNSDYRPYDSSNPDGMGYLVLKKNKTFAEQITKENTIYEIRYPFDLGGSTDSSAATTGSTAKIGTTTYALYGPIEGKKGDVIIIPQEGVTNLCRFINSALSDFATDARVFHYVFNDDGQVYLGYSNAYWNPDSIRYRKTTGHTTVPAGCTFKFNGGKLVNGCLLNSSFSVDSGSSDGTLFQNIILAGTSIVNHEIKTEWFDFVTDGVFDNYWNFRNLSESVNKNGYGKVIFDKKLNYATSLDEFKRNNWTNSFSPIMFRDADVEIDLGESTLRLLPSNTANGQLIMLINCKCYIHDGAIVGDRVEHDYTAYTSYDGTETANFENLANLNQLGGEIIVKRVESKYACGDALILGGGKYSTTEFHSSSFIVDNCELSYCGRQGITAHSSKAITVKNTHIHHIGAYADLPGYNPQAGIDFEFEDGLGDKPITVLENLTINDCSGRAISVAVNTYFANFVCENSVFENAILNLSNLKSINNTGEKVFRSCLIIENDNSEQSVFKQYLGGDFFNCEFRNMSYIAVFPNSWDSCKITTTSDATRLFGSGGSVFPQGSADSSAFPPTVNTTFEVNAGFMQFYNNNDSFVGNKIILGENCIEVRASNFTFKNCFIRTSANNTSRTSTNIGNVKVVFDGCDIQWTGKDTTNIAGYSASSPVEIIGCKLVSTYLGSRASHLKVIESYLESCSIMPTSGGSTEQVRVTNSTLYNCKGHYTKGVHYENCSILWDKEDEKTYILGIGGFYDAFGKDVFMNCTIKVSNFSKNTLSTYSKYYNCKLDVANAYLTGAQFYKSVVESTIENKSAVFEDSLYYLNGVLTPAKSGPTASRPSASAVGAGFTYFDTDLGKMIVSNGTDWVNMDGSAL